MPRSLSFFLLIVSFGILFAGCSQPEPDKSFEDFSFSDKELQTVQEMANSVTGTGPTILTQSGTDMTVPSLSATQQTGTTVTGSATSVTFTPDREKQKYYDSLRLTIVDQGGNFYRVNNPFLNVRAAMDISSALVLRLNQGEVVTVTDIPSAAWAKIKLGDGKEGFVAFRYLAKLTTESKLPEEKKQFEGKYFVDFQFLNIRKDPSTQAEKIGELPGQSIVQPISMNAEWARVAYNGKEGYVSSQYLKPFLPVFLVRQDDYSLPILQYQADDKASMSSLPKHIAALKVAGKKILTLRALYDTVLSQEARDTRISPDIVVLTIAGVTAQNVRQVSDSLQGAAVGGTLFLRTKDIGIAGITEKIVLNLLANGNELQSGAHTGDDLRSLTDSQVSLELGQSKKLIEDLTKKEVYAVAFPGGGVNDRVMKIAAETGYLFGLTQSPDKKFTRAQFLRLPSLFVSSGMTDEDVVKLVK